LCQRRKSNKAERPREDWIPVKVPAIIDKQTWQLAQKLLKEHTRKSPRNSSKNNYLLRGLVICGYCSSMASGYVSHKHTYYSCGAKRNKNLTTKPHNERVAVSHKKLDKKVWQGLVQLLDDLERLKAHLGKKIERLNRQAHKRPVNIGKLENEATKLAIQEKRILDAYREGAISLEELREQKGKIAKRQKVVDEQLQAVQNAQDGRQDSQITLADFEDLSSVYKRAMNKADFPTKAKIANLLIKRVKLFPEKAIVEGYIPIDLDALSNSHRGAQLQSH
jgi:site-specific DNA recombinase